MITGHQGNLRVRMINARENFVARGRMAAHLFRFLGVETLGRVDDAEIDYQLPDIMKITSYGNPFHFLVVPAHFASDDLAVLADAHSVAVGVRVLDVDGPGK